MVVRMHSNLSDHQFKITKYIGVIYKPHGNHKPNIYKKYTPKKERQRNSNRTLKIVIKSQGKRAITEERNKKEL